MRNKISSRNLVLICFLSLIINSGSIQQFHFGGEPTLASKASPVIQSTPGWEGQSGGWQRVPKTDAPQTPSGNFQDCDFYSEKNGWAVGYRSLVHWNGTTWVTFPIPGFSSFRSLHSVEVLGPDNAWAVGDSGTIFHWDGKEWHDISYNTESDLKSISFRSSAYNGFIVGGYHIERDREERLVLHWDGEQWSPFPFVNPGQDDFDPTIYAVQVTSENDGWASGIGKVYRWNGNEWKAYTQANWEGNHISLSNFSILEPDNVWAVGTINGLSMIFHFNGKEWEEIYQTHPYQLQSIKLVSADLGWAVGTFFKVGNPVNSKVFTWDGNGWSEVVREETLLNTVCAFDRDHAWIFGSVEESPVTLRLMNPPGDSQMPMDTKYPETSKVFSEWLWVGLAMFMIVILGLIRLLWKKV